MGQALVTIVKIIKENLQEEESNKNYLPLMGMNQKEPCWE